MSLDLDEIARISMLNGWQLTSRPIGSALEDDEPARYVLAAADKDRVWYLVRRAVGATESRAAKVVGLVQEEVRKNLRKRRDVAHDLNTRSGRVRSRKKKKTK